MRTAERPSGNERVPRLRQPRHGVNFRGLQGFLPRHVGQNGGQTSGQHGFARAGRADEQNVVSACGGYFQRSLHVFLSHDVGKVRLRLLRRRLRRPRGGGGQRLSALQVGDELLHVFHGVHRQPLRQRGLRRVFRRHIEPAYARPLRRHGHGQHAVYGAQPTREAQLAHEGRLLR